MKLYSLLLYNAQLLCALLFTCLPSAYCQIILFGCDFNSSPKCSLKDDTTDSPDRTGRSQSYDWVAGSGLTPSRVQNNLEPTGPQTGFDPGSSTTYGSAGGGYIYIEASTPAERGDYASILTPNLNVLGEICVDFRYSMYGQTIEKLEVLNQTVRRDGGYGEKVLMWSLTGNRGDSWQRGRASATLTPGPGENNQIEFRATRGSNFDSDIALDYIYIYTGRCLDVIPIGGVPTPPPTTPRAVRLPWQCDFEFDICDMSQRTDDQFDWTRTNEETPSSDTGPSRAASGSYYVFIETSSPRVRGDAAAIQTPIIENVGRACASFQYHMYGIDVDRLYVYTERTGIDVNRYIQKPQDQGNQWLPARIDIDLRGNDRVIFRATRGVDIRGDIAIDALDIRQGACQGTTTPSPPTLPGDLPWFCSFETNEICGMIQSTTDNFDWTRQAGQTDTANTGPSSAADQSFYIYAEGSTPRNPNDRALIETPALNYNGDACLRFRYHMYGLDMGSLRVTLRNQNQEVFSITGDRGNQWVSVERNIRLIPGERIVYTATRGASYRSDIAMDDIQISPGTCSGGTPPNPTPGPPPVPTTEPVLRDYFTCDMERDARSDFSCQIRQDTADQFDWSWMRDKTPTGSKFDRRLEDGSRYPVTGPERAQSGTYYLYIEASGRRDNEVARLRLEGNQFRRSGMNCLSFYYSMNGFHCGTLAVYDRANNGNRVTRWKMLGDQGRGWQRAAVDLDMNGVTELGISATTKGQFSGDISVDTITMTPGACQSVPAPYLWRCTFETNTGAATLCGLMQDITYDTNGFDWTLWKGATPSKETGPSRAYSGDFYLYIEASNPRRQGDNAGILLPDLGFTGDVCVEFFFNMFGFHIGQLEIFTRADNNGFNDQRRWNMVGEQGIQWREQRTTISSLRPGQQIGFKGVRGGEFSGDIAIDSIQVRPGAC